MRPAIEAQDLSKVYSLGSRQRGYRTLRETLTSLPKVPWQRLKRWSASYSARRGGQAPSTRQQLYRALKDVSFEIKSGDIVGIIGPNGAGKSTLLKVLSRIVEPTTGRVLVRGRVGSLLEVGTGFHPELTGRENVFLNGAILGMPQREIARKFDEIVAFAEIGEFLDTPVKRYSSGMYVRLAFAVAAHLDPDILLVDEVLAVGDTAFQRRCMQRMDEIGASGKTVLLVSHNLASIQSLCKTAITLEKGNVVAVGPADLQISRYLGRLADLTQTPLSERTDRDGTGQVRITHLRFTDQHDHAMGHALSGSVLNVVLGYQAPEARVRPDVLSLSFWSQERQKIFHVDTVIRGKPLAPLQSTGEYCCSFPALPLPPGQYSIDLYISVGGQMADHVSSAARLQVLPGDYYGTGRVTVANGGLVFVDHEWS